jgi:MFS transporter, FSR family, fosmidomycin resistance protein
LVQPKTGKTGPVLAGAAALAAALAVELVDELAGSTRSAALPLIRQGLALSYGQIGLLESAPLLLGSLLELPLGILAGHGRRRRLAVLAGGIVFTLALLATAGARSFAALVVAFVLFFPASGAFVSLTQADLMDADPGRREQHMARWQLAGAAGSVAGPALLIAVLAAGGGWRSAYVVLAAAAAAAWLGVARNPPGAGLAEGGQDRPGGAAAARRALAALREPGVARWLILLQVSDLLLDVFTGFLALYAVAVVHATPAQAALVVAVRLGAGLAGDAVLIGALRHAGEMTLLRASAAAAAVAYPAFLLVPGLAAKLLILGCLSMATAPWYPLLQARLYGSLPDRSEVVVSLLSAAGLAGGAAPLAIGFLAQRFGIAWALAGLAVAPVWLLGGVWRPAAPALRGPPPGDNGAPPAAQQHQIANDAARATSDRQRCC